MDRLPAELLELILWEMSIEDIRAFRCAGKRTATIGQHHIEYRHSIDIAAGGLESLSGLAAVDKKDRTRSLQFLAVYPPGRPGERYVLCNKGYYTRKDKIPKGNDWLRANDNRTRSAQYFVKALPQFPRLEHITLIGDIVNAPTGLSKSTTTTTTTTTPRQVRHWRAPSWRSEPTCRIEHRTLYAAHYLVYLLRALQETDTRLVSFRIQWVSWVFLRLDSENLGQLLSSMNGLQRFYCNLLNDDPPYGDYQPVEFEAARPWGNRVTYNAWHCRQTMQTCGFNSFLREMKELRTLHLAFSFGTEVPSDQWKWRCSLKDVIPIGFQWRHLSSLRLVNVKAESSDLEELLSRHGDTLRVLYLEDINITNGCWIRVLSGVRPKLSLLGACFNGCLGGYHEDTGEAQCWDLHRNPQLRDALNQYFLAPIGEPGEPGREIPLNKYNDVFDEYDDMFSDDDKETEAKTKAIWRVPFARQLADNRLVTALSRALRSSKNR